MYYVRFIIEQYTKLSRQITPSPNLLVFDTKCRVCPFADYILVANNILTITVKLFYDW